MVGKLDQIEELAADAALNFFRFAEKLYFDFSHHISHRSSNVLLDAHKRVHNRAGNYRSLKLLQRLVEPEALLYLIHSAREQNSHASRELRSLSDDRYIRFVKKELCRDLTVRNGLELAGFFSSLGGSITDSIIAYQ